MSLPKLKPETRAIHGHVPASDKRENSSPIFLNSSFNFATAEDAEAVFLNQKEAYLYSRFSNPNTDELANKIADLEGAESAICVASGMSAVFNALLPFLSAGDHMVSSINIFGNSLNIINDFLPKWGIEYTLAEFEELKNIEELLQNNTKLVFVETPSNPSLRLFDIEALAKVCKQKNVLLIVDNCFATPFGQQPLQFGADLVIHSATKFIDGQGRVLGGIIAGKKQWVGQCFNFLRRTGPSLSPFNAHLLSKSVETLGLRMVKHSSNALLLAQNLEKHKNIKRVYYPGLPSHPDHHVFKKQMDLGGALIAFEIVGAKKEAMALINSLSLFRITANLGDSRSIITHPASTTHSKLTSQELDAAGISGGLMRVSVGLEHPDDLWNDLKQGLDSL